LAQFRGQPLLVIFFNPACGFCRALLPKLKDKAENRKQKPQMEAGGDVAGNGGPPQRRSVLIITTGDAEANRRYFAEHKAGCPVLLQKDGEVAQAYQVNGTPAGYPVSADGKIASELAIGAEALLRLAAQSVPLTPALSASEGERQTAANGGDVAQASSPASWPGVPPGVGAGSGTLPQLAAGTDCARREPTGNGEAGRVDRFSQRSIARSKIKRDGLKADTLAPDFRLPRLDGLGELSLSELRGRRVLLVFSSPGCGPCNVVAPELEKFHRAHPELEVVMVSKGEPKDNRAKVKEHGLTFPVLLQQQWEISRRYAMFATPIAYLIDEQGVIAHDVAVGMDAILGLLAKAGEFVPAGSG